MIITTAAAVAAQTRKGNPESKQTKKTQWPVIRFICSSRLLFLSAFLLVPPSLPASSYSPLLDFSTHPQPPRHPSSTPFQSFPALLPPPGVMLIHHQVPIRPEGHDPSTKYMHRHSALATGRLGWVLRALLWSRTWGCERRTDERKKWPKN